MIGFAIPAATAVDVAQRLLAGGPVGLVLIRGSDQREVRVILGSER